MSGSVAQCCPLVYTSWIVNLQKILGNKIYFTTAPSVNRCFCKVGNTGDRHKHLSSSCAQGFTDDRQKSSLFFAPWRMRLITKHMWPAHGIGSNCCLRVCWRGRSPRKGPGGVCKQDEAFGSIFGLLGSGRVLAGDSIEKMS
jgi:hypothetical protein